ncbi:helix-turn-helix transcriptional regulator [Catenuloplanes indicus JCM 9534]
MQQRGRVRTGRERRTAVEARDREQRDLHRGHHAEVALAALAHLSVTYYERLEQGRGPHPSAATLTAIAGALRLTGERREHLFRLAGQAAPGSPGADGTPDPGLLSLLHANALTPGYLADDLGTVLAQNPLNVALFGPFTGLPGWDGNLVWRWFTSPAWRELLEPGEDHAGTARAYVTDLRAVAARRGHDETAVALVHDLRAASTEFTRMWDEHDVSALHCSDKHMDGLHLRCVVVTSPHSSQRLLLLHPVPGTGTDARLAALAPSR